jgi:hypothetical protein
MLYAVPVAQSNEREMPLSSTFTCPIKEEHHEKVFTP